MAQFLQFIQIVGLLSVRKKWFKYKIFASFENNYLVNFSVPRELSSRLATTPQYDIGFNICHA